MQLTQTMPQLVFIAISVFFSGCGPVKPDSLPGRYNLKSGSGDAVLVLNRDGTFTEGGVAKDKSAMRIEGKWSLKDCCTLSRVPCLRIAHNGIENQLLPECDYIVRRSVLGRIEIDQGDPDFEIAYVK